MYKRTCLQTLHGFHRNPKQTTKLSREEIVILVLFSDSRGWLKQDLCTSKHLSIANGYERWQKIPEKPMRREPGVLHSCTTHHCRRILGRKYARASEQGQVPNLIRQTLSPSQIPQMLQATVTTWLRIPCHSSRASLHVLNHTVWGNMLGGNMTKGAVSWKAKHFNLVY